MPLTARACCGERGVAQDAGSAFSDDRMRLGLGWVLAWVKQIGDISPLRVIVPEIVGHVGEIERAARVCRGDEVAQDAAPRVVTWRKGRPRRACRGVEPS